MERKYLTSNPLAKIYLESLISDIDPAHYKDAFLNLGIILGDDLLKTFDFDSDTISILSTVEDADFLMKGVITSLERQHKKTIVNVFWNNHFTPEGSNTSVAPILKIFNQKGFQNTNNVIIVKSIISSGCVIRTNLTKFLNSNPLLSNIYIIAPVIMNGAKEKLLDDFPKNIASKFHFLSFAEDYHKDMNGNVQPGIGGSVYERMGFKNQEEKNKYSPQIVRERRNL